MKNPLGCDGGTRPCYWHEISNHHHPGYVVTITYAIGSSINQYILPRQRAGGLFFSGFAWDCTRCSQGFLSRLLRRVGSTLTPSVMLYASPIHIVGVGNGGLGHLAAMPPRAISASLRQSGVTEWKKVEKSKAPSSWPTASLKS